MTAYIAPGLQTPEEIIVSEFGVTMDDVLSRIREDEYVEPRRIIMWYYKTHKGYSFARAGRLVKRDHATAMNAVKKVNGFLDVDKEYRHMIERLMQRINAVQKGS